MKLEGSILDPLRQANGVAASLQYILHHVVLFSPDYSVALRECFDLVANLLHHTSDITAEDVRVCVVKDVVVLQLPIDRVDRYSMALDEDLLRTWLIVWSVFHHESVSLCLDPSCLILRHLDRGGKALSRVANIFELLQL